MWVCLLGEYGFACSGVGVYPLVHFAGVGLSASGVKVCPLRGWGLSASGLGVCPSVHYVNIIVEGNRSSNILFECYTVYSIIRNHIQKYKSDMRE